MSDPDWDVVVVGSGAGGGAAAYALCARGLKVLLLEAGPRFDPARDYPLDRPDWETRGIPFKPGVQGRYTYDLSQPLIGDEPALRSWNRVRGIANRGSTRQVIGYEHVRGVGGSTLHFTAESHRLNPASFRMRSRFGVAADWPLSYAELEPWYCQVEELIGVAGPPDQGARWRSRPFPLPPHPMSFAAQTLGRGAAALGLTWQPNSNAVLSRPYRGRVECNYCGGCQRGCPRGDKGSFDVAFVAAALATGRCDLRPESPVIRIERGSDDRIAAVLVARPGRAIERIVTPRLVLAAGAIETPRLLLASDNLANESGEVGRNLTETLISFVGALHPQAQHGRRGVPADAVVWDYNAPDAIPGIVGGCRFYSATAENGPPGLMSYAMRAVPGWGAAHRQAMRETYGHALMVGSIGESITNPGNRVSLDPVERDAAGIPLARIAARLEPQDVERLRFMTKTATDILVASGASDIFEAYISWDRLVMSHPTGTCRMGDDPERSVVDAWSRSHRWQNLFIADASILPSSGGGEGHSLTLAALALRMADHLG